MHGQENKKKNR